MKIMKIRNGFVSNSSSSSFILAFKNMPKSVAELQKMLFNDDCIFRYYEKSYSTEEISKIIFSDVQSALKVNVPEIAEEIRQGEVNTTTREKPKYSELDNDAWEMYEIKSKLFSLQLAIDFVEEHPNGKYVILEYGDEVSGIFSVIEHGGIFDNIPNMRVNKH